MFGLLKNRNLTAEETSDFRLNYCGTCKTIGKLYGQKERVLLNSDVVFLSELLASVNNRKEDFKYIKPHTCFTLPKREEQIPQFLKYTASINILLGHYKIIDNLNDSKYKYNIWTLIQRIGNSNFKKAKNYLAKLQLPVEFIEKEIQEQFHCENESKFFDNFQDTFKYYCRQTAKITGIAFEYSVANFNDQQLSKIFSEIGTNFGEIIYLIDAIDDYEKDKKRGKFNLFLLHNRTDKKKLVEEVKNYIYNGLEQIKSCINTLPITESKKGVFISNLFLNVSNKISPKICCSKMKHCTAKKFSIKERYQFAITTAKNISQEKKSLIIRYSSLTFLTALLIILFIMFPQLIHAANSTPNKADCCSDFFNWGNHCSCCGTCCGTCCDGCIGDCCGTDGRGGTLSNGHAATDIGNACPCASCCGCLCIIGICGSCLPAAAETPTVIVKVITAPAKTCCD
jgi:hypothetical protein